MSGVNRFIEATHADAKGVMNRTARRSRGGRSNKRTLKSRVVRFGTTGVVIAAGGGAALLPAGGSESSAAAGSSLAGPVPGQVVYSQSQAIAAGIFTRKMTVNSDGSRTYTYKYANGITVTSVTPPPGFQPLTASDAELSKYGFPIRPTTSAGLASWTKNMAAYRHTVTPNLSIEVAPSGATTAATNTSDGPHTKWGGYIAYSTTSHHFQSAWAHFAAPNLGAVCGSPYGMSIWTGMGGYGNTRLIQSGIEAGENFGGSTVWQPFWELVGPATYGQQPLKAATTEMAVNPGNVLWSKTTYSSSTGGKARFYIENDTTGTVASVTAKSPNGLFGTISNYYDGNTSDFITEDPNYPNQPIPFSSFAFVTADANGSGLSNDNPVKLTNTQVTASSITTSAEGFSVGWGRC